MVPSDDLKPSGRLEKPHAGSFSSKTRLKKSEIQMNYSPQRHEYTQIVKLGTQSSKSIQRASPQKVQKIKLPSKVDKTKNKKTLLMQTLKQGKPIFSQEDYRTFESRPRVDTKGYIEGRKLSVKDLDRHFGTVKHSVSSQKLPGGSIARASTALNRETETDEYADLNDRSEQTEPPIHPRAVAKNKANAQMLESFQRQQKKAL